MAIGNLLILTIGPARALEGSLRRSPTSLRRSVSCSDDPGRGWTTNCNGFEPPIVSDADRFDDAILSEAKCCINHWTFHSPIQYIYSSNSVNWRDIFLLFSMKIVSPLLSRELQQFCTQAASKKFWKHLKRSKKG